MATQTPVGRPEEEVAVSSGVELDELNPPLDDPVPVPVFVPVAVAAEVVFGGPPLSAVFDFPAVLVVAKSLLLASVDVIESTLAVVKFDPES
jgi:hypothetical protein